MRYEKLIRASLLERKLLNFLKTLRSSERVTQKKVYGFGCHFCIKLIHFDCSIQVGKMRTLKVDGQTLQQLTKLSITEVHKLCNETSKTLDPDLLIAKMVHIYKKLKVIFK
jgi:hypothetical protein